jgi:hypothetical protein
LRISDARKSVVAVTGRQHVCLGRALFLRMGPLSVCYRIRYDLQQWLRRDRDLSDKRPITEAETPVANSHLATNDESRSSQCTSAIASKAHITCRWRQDHSIGHSSRQTRSTGPLPTHRQARRQHDAGNDRARCKPAGSSTKCSTSMICVTRVEIADQSGVMAPPTD